MALCHEYSLEWCTGRSISDVASWFCSLTCSLAHLLARSLLPARKEEESQNQEATSEMERPVAGNTENQEAKSDEGNPPLLSVKKTSEINRVLLDASERVSE